jgi:hypothetical protein
MLTEFCECLIPESIRVYPPKRYVLLCGGEVSNIHAEAPQSLRDAFLMGGGIGALKNSDILQIEEIQEFFDKSSPYIDLIEFEKDIAQICELVILFSESPGSFTELGSFSVFREICDKLLLIIQRRFLSRPSFITQGPIANLQRDHPNSVFSIIDARIGMTRQQIETANCKSLVETVKIPIERRLVEVDSRTTIDLSKFNHLCKTYVGLLREFYSLKDDDLLLLLDDIGFTIDENTLNRVAFCCKALKWASSTTAGFDRVHFAFPSLNEATKFEFRAPLADKIRRRSEFRRYWERADPDRVAAVDEELA